jgi:hypothetical protein
LAGTGGGPALLTSGADWLNLGGIESRILEEARMTNRGSQCLRLLGLALLAVAVAGFFGACKGKEAEEVKAVEQPKAINMETLKPVFGEARDDISGVVDVTSGAAELIVAYRVYDADLQNIDNDMVTDLAPKIQALYKDFPSLDRVVFEITVNGETPGEWKPYISFALNRKAVDEIQWSGILAEDFLRTVLDYKRY